MEERAMSSEAHLDLNESIEEPPPGSGFTSSIRPLNDFSELAAQGLEAFLAQLSDPVLIAGAFTTAPLDDPTFANDATLSSVEANKGPPQVIPLHCGRGGRAGALWMGRGIACDVLLPFSNVSRVHARLTHTSDGGLRVADARSRNGSWRNGIKLEPGIDVLLHDGDLLRLGSLELRFLLPETLYWHLHGSHSHPTEL